MLRIFLVIVKILGMIILQIDIIDSYLESSCRWNKHLINIKILQKCETGWEGLVFKIFKSLYGLKQVGRFWNKTFIKFFQKIGFVSTNENLYILTFQKSNVFIIIRVYVDDLAFVSKSQDELDYLKSQLAKSLI